MDESKKTDLTLLASALLCMGLLVAAYAVPITLCADRLSTACQQVKHGQSNEWVRLIEIALVFGAWPLFLVLSAQVFWLALFAYKPFSVVIKPALQLTFFITVPGFASLLLMDWPIAVFVALLAVLGVAYIFTGHSAFKASTYGFGWMKRAILSITAVAVIPLVPFTLFVLAFSLI